MSHERMAEKNDVANDIIYEKYLDVSDAVDSMSKLKNILETEISLQQQILETSVVLGFTFDIENDEANEFDEGELFKTFFENKCLEAEINVVTKVLSDIKRDYKELESEEVTETFNDDLDDLRRKSISTSHQLKEDVIEGKFL